MISLTSPFRLRFLRACRAVCYTRANKRGLGGSLPLCRMFILKQTDELYNLILETFERFQRISLQMFVEHERKFELFAARKRSVNEFFWSQSGIQYSLAHLCVRSNVGGCCMLFMMAYEAALKTSCFVYVDLFDHSSTWRKELSRRQPKPPKSCVHLFDCRSIE